MSLLACPFCGEQPTTHKPKEVSIDLDLSLVGCSNDKCNVVHYLFTPDKWNNRPGEQAARVEGLEEMRQELVHVNFNENWWAIQDTFDGIWDKLIKATR